jgi:hypothetical protein
MVPTATTIMDIRRSGGVRTTMHIIIMVRGTTAGTAIGEGITGMVRPTEGAGTKSLFPIPDIFQHF